MNPDLINVHNQCIVQLSDDIESDNVRGIANALVKRAGATNKYVYENSIKGFTINLPCQAADRAFGASAWVERMEPDSIVSISKGKPNRGGEDTSSGEPTQTQDWGVVRVGAPIDDKLKYNNVSTDFTATAWVIDSGVDLDHPDLNVDASRGFSVFGGKPNDQNGHGTHVAGTIAAIDNEIGSIGVAPGATIVPVRVLDRRGSGTISGVIAGVNHVAAKAMPGDCVNMSLGGGASDILDAAVNVAAESGAYFALAAGNSRVDAQNHSPAKVGGIFSTDNIFTIAAIDINDKMTEWSNYGDVVEYAAPHACAVLMLTGADSYIIAENYYDEDNGEYPIIHTGE
jgi:subtilisin family serine protease